MAAPKLTFSISGEKVSAVSGFDYIIVAFQSDIPYQAFECRATKAGEEYGVGKGALIASFSTINLSVGCLINTFHDFVPFFRSFPALFRD